MSAEDPVYLEALRALAAAGASDQLLSQAVRELLAAGERTGFSAVPPTSDRAQTVPTPASPRDITTPFGLPRSTAERPGGLVSPNLSTGAQPKRKPVIVVFKEANGHRTSVSLAADKWAALLELQPDAGTVTKLVRAVGPAAPAEVNRSSWVYEQVVNRLRLPANG
ncbi:hypothetical protein H6P1_00154 (plasmid) [Variovorax sp. PBL-H6]|nr:hypothetical protein H6P1_00154 [Variovorax sp. PBL-H6]VTU44070.1 hypothetical protein SRS16P1_00748 [Variovorax sp. SRS16]VTU44152.1 hypothetical protein E5P1_00741 [Variovorax sp. PBL-E5]